MAALAYSAITPLTADTCTGPRIDNMRFGGSLVSITTATRSPLRSALSFGAPPNVLITSSDPFQWNHRATTRGVPSVHTYARRAREYWTRAGLARSGHGVNLIHL